MWNKAGALLAGVMVLLSVAACPTDSGDDSEQGADFYDRETLFTGGTLLSTAATIDINTDKGQLFRSERYNNIYAAPEASTATKQADTAFYVAQGLKPKVLRVWVGEHDVYDPSTGEFHWDASPSHNDYYRAVSEMADELCLVISSDIMFLDEGATHPEGKGQGWGYTAAQGKPIIKAIVKHLKQNFPKVTYIECMNEPDNMMFSRGSLHVTEPDTVYSYYKEAYYEAIKEVDTELGLTGNRRLKIGTPAFAFLDESWLKGFFEDLAADQSPATPDFISYHGYFANLNQDMSGMFLNNPAGAAAERAKIDSWLTEKNLSADIPSYITETGLFPGPMSAHQTVAEDVLNSSAGMASVGYWYTQSAKNFPFHWILRHVTNGRKDQLISDRTGSNILELDQPTQAFTPYGNMVKMQSLMKGTKVTVTVPKGIEATSGNSAGIATIDSKGMGGYVLASKDANGVSVMLWNYQRQDDGPEVKIPLKLENLDSVFANGRFKLTTYVIDDTHCNYVYAPDDPNLKPFEPETVTLEGTSYTTSVSLGRNAAALLLLEKD